MSPSSADDRPAVLGAWLLSGGALGLAGGVTRRLLFGADHLQSDMLIGVAGMGAAAMVAMMLDDRRREGAVALVDGRGRRRQVRSGWLYAVPIAVGAPSLFWLGVVGTVQVGSALPVVGFGAAGATALWAARRVVARDALRRALESLEAGDASDARAALEDLATARWVPSSEADTARLNLGMVALASGELIEAERWLARVRLGVPRTFATVSLALLRVLDGQLDAGESLLGTLYAQKAGQVVRTQADAVRTLIVLRREGVDSGRDLAERLHERSGSLLTGLVAYLRWKQGDEAGADAALFGNRATILGSGMAGLVPEIAEVLAALPGD